MYGALCGDIELETVVARGGPVTSKELLDAGELLAAIAQLNQEVRTAPTDLQRRTFLFELLCFAGDYQRAIRQLEVIGSQSANAAVGVQVYRNILTAETARQRLLSDTLQPEFLCDPPPYVHWHLQALNRLREQQLEEAEALLAQAAAARLPVRGEMDGNAFNDFRDGDDFLAPFLEVILHQRYIWVPFEHIKYLRLSPPQQLRDLLWLPAALETHLGPVGEVFLPVLYIGSHTHHDDQVKLGRMTDWIDVGAGLARGAGQRLFFSDGQDRGILEVEELTFLPTASPGGQ